MAAAERGPGEPCPDPDCPGLIDEGYCAFCGSPAVPAGSVAPAGPADLVGPGRDGDDLSGPGADGDDLTALPPLPSGRTAPTRPGGSRPVVPEHRRICPFCRGPAGGAGSSGDSCPSCGEPVSFEPPLRSGDVVGDHFVVDRVVGHGGLGWVYRAWDSDLRIWVALKGQIDPRDPDGRTITATELRALAAVRHPGVVRVYGRVRHPRTLTRRDGRTESVDVDYIVMDFVEGRSLLDLRTEHGPMPVDVVLRYVVRILHAFAHLHSLGLLYCDLAPDQVIHTVAEPAELVLVDLGAARRAGSRDGVVFGRPGYQDPAIRRDRTPPTEATDLYTVARTALRLTADDPEFSTSPHRPPPAPGSDLWATEHASYLRLLHRMACPDHDARFGSAAEAAVQADGVLREEIARSGRAPVPAPSTLFGPELGVAGADSTTFPEPADDPAAVAAALPDLRIAPSTRHAGLLGALAGLPAGERRRELLAVPDPTTDTRLRAASIGIRLGGAERDAAVAELAALAGEYPRDARPRYLGGVAELAAGRVPAARTLFEGVLDHWPGEQAPKLALAACAESAGRPADAAPLYETVWRTDPGSAGAAFGLSRCRMAAGDRAGAAAALGTVPPSSRWAPAAGVCAVLARVRDADPSRPPDPDLFAAAERLHPDRPELAGLDREVRARVTAVVLKWVLGWIRSGRPGNATNDAVPDTFLGRPLTERAVRDGLEAAHRELAELDRPARVRHIDTANRLRNRTWL